MNLFMQNKIQIEQHNQLYQNGSVPHEMLLNEFSDPPDELDEQIFVRFDDLK